MNARPANKSAFLLTAPATRPTAAGRETLTRKLPASNAPFSRLLKNTHLLRCAHPSSLRRTVKYASFLLISRALHLDVFDQPGRKLHFQQPAIGKKIILFSIPG
jgi:hypothetical protein